jgi:hypothetical protein
VPWLVLLRYSGTGCWPSLRFLEPPTLAAFLAGAGFTIEAQYGDWHRGPITDTSREIITIAHRI